MYPVIFQLGPIIVYSLWLFAGLAFLLGVFVFLRLVRLKKLDMNFIYKHSFSIFIWGIVGSRLFFVLENYNYYFYEFSASSLLGILYIWDKGLSLLGALLGIIISLIYFSYKDREQTYKWLDVLSISIISGISLGHIGAFLDGANYGNETSLPWGIVFDNPSVIYAVPIHPVQIYAFIYAAIIAIALFFIYKMKIFKKGKITYIALVSYFGMMFIEGFFRGDDALTFWIFRFEQWFALIIVILTSGYLIYIYNKNRKNNLTLKKHGNI